MCIATQYYHLNIPITIQSLSIFPSLTLSQGEREIERKKERERKRERERERLIYICLPLSLSLLSIKPRNRHTCVLLHNIIPLITFPPPSYLKQTDLINL